MSPLPVTIGADHVALCDLCLDSCPAVATRKQATDAVPLVGDVIKLEDSEVRFTTGDALVVLQISEEPFLILFDDSELTLLRDLSMLGKITVVVSP